MDFLTFKTRPEPHFLTVFTMFCARAWIFTEKNATSKIIKKSPKNQFPPGGAVFALAPPSPKPTPPKGHFWRYLRCFMHIEQSSKMTVFLPPGRGSAAAARPPIAKAKAKPHAMRSNMPGIRCLVHRRIEGLPPMPPTPKRRGCVSVLRPIDSWRVYFLSSDIPHKSDSSALSWCHASTQLATWLSTCQCTALWHAFAF